MYAFESNVLLPFLISFIFEFPATESNTAKTNIYSVVFVTTAGSVTWVLVKVLTLEQVTLLSVSHLYHRD